jgi:Ca2+-binding RTX toxin-like protein
VSVQFVAAPGEANEIGSRFEDGGAALFTDTAPLIAGDYCELADPGTVRCRPAGDGFLRFEILAGDMGDVVTAGIAVARLGSGADRFEGGPDADTAFGGEGADKLTGARGADNLSGGAGSDQVTGGRGSDRLLAGPGSDLVMARDGRRDVVRCGPGLDRAEADRRDRLSGCESVSIGRAR